MGEFPTRWRTFDRSCLFVFDNLDWARQHFVAAFPSRAPPVNKEWPQRSNSSKGRGPATSPRSLEYCSRSRRIQPQVYLSWHSHIFKTVFVSNTSPFSTKVCPGARRYRYPYQIPSFFQIWQHKFRPCLRHIPFEQTSFSKSNIRVLKVICKVLIRKLSTSNTSSRRFFLALSTSSNRFLALGACLGGSPVRSPYLVYSNPYLSLPHISSPKGFFPASMVTTTWWK